MKPYNAKDNLNSLDGGIFSRSTGWKFYSLQIFYVNHSINFFLYCITGKRFRLALQHACCPCWCPWRTTTLDQRTTVAISFGSRRACLFQPRDRTFANGAHSCPSTPTGTRHTYNTVGVRLSCGKSLCTSAGTLHHKLMWIDDRSMRTKLQAESEEQLQYSVWDSKAVYHICV